MTQLSTKPEPPTREEIRKYFASGPCETGCCKCSGPWSHSRSMSAAHRLVDVIRHRASCGETITELAEDYDIHEEIAQYIISTPLAELKWLRWNPRKKESSDE